MSQMHRQLGLTLLEMLISIALTLIITVSAVPAYQNFVKTSARSSASMELYRAMILARSEAISRNRKVSVCALDPSSPASFPQCIMSATSDWNGGWLVFADSTNLCAATEPDRVEDIVAVFNPVSERIDVEHNLTNPCLDFAASGRSNTQFEFMVCDKDKALEGRRVNANAAGVVYLREATCVP